MISKLWKITTWKTEVKHPVYVQCMSVCMYLMIVLVAQGVAFNWQTQGPGNSRRSKNRDCESGLSSAERPQSLANEPIKHTRPSGCLRVSGQTATTSMIYMSRTQRTRNRHKPLKIRMHVAVILASVDSRRRSKDKCRKATTKLNKATNVTSILWTVYFSRLLQFTCYSEFRCPMYFLDATIIS